MSAHHALYGFHQDHVALGKAEIDRLRRFRDLNLERLREGLIHLRYPAFVSARGQGGYAMSTLTQRDDGEQDIDVALIFNAADLPGRPADARELVHQAVLAAAPEGFRRAPERRTNAVTVWYSGGFHIDFAVYRTAGRKMEHAGASWKPASPAASVDWFVRENRRLSPKWHPNDLVAAGQLRRIVRFMKYLRQCDKKVYPGGYVITALACRYYVPSQIGDDVALAWTLAGAAQGIVRGNDVPDPVVQGRSLVPRQKDVDRLLRYGRLLSQVLAPLRPLYARRQRRTDAVAAWEQALGADLPIPQPVVPRRNNV
jgi:hypothetical protein